MKEFTPHTQEELKELGIIENQIYRVKYINKDYFNGEKTEEIANAKAVMNGDKILFLIPDPYGMDRFIDSVRIV